MKNSIKLLFFFKIFGVFFIQQAYSQCTGCPTSPQLLPNPDFELATSSCNNAIQNGSELFINQSPVQGWFGTETYIVGNLAMSTPDYRRINNAGCGSLINAPNSICVGGNSALGYFVKAPGVNTREYVQAQLNSPLVAGKMYCFSMKVKSQAGAAGNQTNNTDGVGVWIHGQGIINWQTMNTVGGQFLGPGSTVNATPQIQATSIIPHNSCTTLTGTICATGNEQWIVIGNFRSDANTATTGTGSAYMQIDDVSLIEMCSTPLNVALSASPTTLCAGGCTTISASASGGAGTYTYSWSPGGATTSSISPCPTVTTTYTLTTTSGSPCLSLSSYTSTITINVGSNAILNINSPGAICSGQSATLTATPSVTGGAYLWSPGGGTTASIIVTPSAATTYTCVYTLNGCTSVNVATVNSSGSITATVNNSIICPGDFATLTASGGITYSWSNGQTTTSIIVSPTITTNYTVIAYSGACTDTVSSTVTVTNNITATISGNTTVCTGNSTTLIASGGNNYSWSTGASGNTIVITPAASGTYSVIVGSGTCVDSTSISVTVLPPPTAIVSNATICSGSIATLTASGGITYAWSNGSTNVTINVSPLVSTTYSVVVSNGGCSSNAFATVSVNPSPSVSATGNTTLCIGDISTLSASGGTAYSWSNGNTGAIINVSPSTTTTYSVTTSNGSCTSSTSITVVVSPKPIGVASGATICAGQSTVLTASGGSNYSWSNGNTTSSINVTPASTSTYSVIVSVGSCRDIATATVVVNPNPTAFAWNNVTITAGNSITLAASGGGTYSWSNGDNASTITVSPLLTNIFCVTVANANSCTDIACVTVYVEPIECSPVSSEEAFAIPSAFSPNMDGENDKWRLLHIPLLDECIGEFKISIYNRWGEKVFEGSDINFFWDGTYHGKIEDAAVFAYYMNATLKSGIKIKKRGNVSLIR